MYILRFASLHSIICFFNNPSPQRYFVNILVQEIAALLHAAHIVCLVRSQSQAKYGSQETDLYIIHAVATHKITGADGTPLSAVTLKLKYNGYDFDNF